jgi:hypothetical protein
MKQKCHPLDSNFLLTAPNYKYLSLARAHTHTHKINEVCEEELEGYMPTLKNPTIIMFNVPEDITSENTAQAIVLQNSEMNLNESEIKPKFMFEDRKKHKNLVTEVNSETHKCLVDRKLKIG